MSRRLSTNHFSLKIFCTQRFYAITQIHGSCLWIAFYPEIILSISAVFREYITQQQVFFDFGRSGGNFREIGFLRLPTRQKLYSFQCSLTILLGASRYQNCLLISQEIYKPLAICLLFDLAYEWINFRCAPFGRIFHKRIIQIN